MIVWIIVFVIYILAGLSHLKVEVDENRCIDTPSLKWWEGVAIVFLWPLVFISD